MRHKGSPRTQQKAEKEVTIGTVSGLDNMVSRSSELANGLDLSKEKVFPSTWSDSLQNTRCKAMVKEKTRWGRVEIPGSKAPRSTAKL